MGYLGGMARLLIDDRYSKNHLEWVLEQERYLQDTSVLQVMLPVRQEQQSELQSATERAFQLRTNELTAEFEMKLPVLQTRPPEGSQGHTYLLI